MREKREHAGGRAHQEAASEGIGAHQPEYEAVAPRGRLCCAPRVAWEGVSWTHFSPTFGGQRKVHMTRAIAICERALLTHRVGGWLEQLTVVLQPCQNARSKRRWLGSAVMALAKERRELKKSARAPTSSSRHCWESGTIVHWREAYGAMPATAR